MPIRVSVKVSEGEQANLLYPQSRVELFMEKMLVEYKVSERWDLQFPPHITFIT